MTARERFRETLRFGTPDRIPLLMEGIRQDVLKKWQKESNTELTKIENLFLSDRSIEIDLDFDPLSFLTDFPISNSDLISFRKKMTDLDLNSIWNEQKKMLTEFNDLDEVVFLKVHSGLFLDLGIDDWEGFTDALIFLVENPAIVKESMNIQCEFISKYLNIVLREIKIDAVIFNEPIGGNEGPLISPSMYEEFALKYYQNIIIGIQALGIDCIILRSYANIRILIPLLLKYGFNTLWACETEGSTMDYLKLRNEFGRDLSLIGGIDLDILRSNKEEIQNLVSKVSEPLIKSGGYIPLLDGRVRKDIKFENYLFYRQLLELIANR